MALNHHSRIYTVILLLVASWQSIANAQTELELHVSASSSEPDTSVLRLADLDAMQQVEFTTSTIWTDGEVEFSGVPLKAVLSELDAKGDAVEMIALNDYKVLMPLNDIEDDIPIIATRMNGETISVRDKGPYWVVFPYDQDPKYQTETVYSYSIWQLNRLNVVD